MLAPVFGGAHSKVEAVGVLTASSGGTTLTGHATAGTQQTVWTQLIASTGFDYNYVVFFVSVEHGGVLGRGLVDFAIGGAGSEQSIGLWLPAVGSGASARAAGYSIALPYYIPGGSRISARMEYASAISFATKVAILGMMHGPMMIPPFRRIETLGRDITPGTDAGLTQLPANATANLLGAVTSLGTSTNPARCLYGISRRWDPAAETVNLGALVGYYTDSGGVEVLIPEHPSWQLNSTNDMDTPSGVGIGPVFVDFPAGQQYWAATRVNAAASGTLRTSQAGLILLS